MDRKSIGNTVMLKEEKRNSLHKQGDIFIPDIVTEETRFWRVVGLGTGSTDKHGNITPFKVKVGELILIDMKNHVPTTVHIQGEKIVIINQNAVLAKLEE